MNSLTYRNLIDVAGNSIKVDKYILMLAKCLTYNSVVSFSNYGENLETFIKNTLPQKISEVISDSTVNISFMTTRDYISNLNKFSISALNETEIKRVIVLFRDKEALVKFDPKYFDVAMYKVSSKNITAETMSFLRSVHDNVMSKIAYYYNSKYDIPLDAIDIVNSKYQVDLIGHGILFNISGIKPQQVYSDILKGDIVFEYEDVDIVENSVYILI